MHTLYSPPTTDKTPETAQLIEARFEVICPENNYYYCSGCVVTRVLNPEEVVGKIAFFSKRTYDDNTHCGSYQELSVIAELAGATAAIIPYLHSNFLPLAVAPYAIPYELSITTLIMDYTSAMFIQNYIDNDSTDPDFDHPVAKFPKLLNGWGESFYPVVDDEGVLPQASICYTSGAKGRLCHFAGQATFGPDEIDAFESRILKAVIATECAAEDDVDGGKGGEGNNCDVCHEYV